ncbi:M4 family metallopeptidase [Actinokineospora inagensis]|uniref:M4 family metallopeptidase n=1 Tax=Actinokineospora inagensis TaxID=103730 RepID=UPI00040C187D|nr:M4 family metallopeptidase [Actinokineospora inagensis]
MTGSRMTVRGALLLSAVLTLWSGSTAPAYATGAGTGAWNMNPVPLDTTHSGSTYSMRDPRWPGLACQDAVTNTVFSGPDDVWGNGDPIDRETGCVDALYAAQNFQRMAVNWLGRNGADGNGRASLSIRVGVAQLGLGTSGSVISVGHNTSGQWVGSLDLIGREYGRVIDQYTPTGPSANGTAEFIADAFGTANEWYAAQPAGDVPDFLIGERVNVLGQGPLRDMANPAATGGRNCYAADIPRIDPVAAAGVGDHWFVLLAAGSANSPTCDGLSATGIGVQRAIKILYAALQLKTSGSSYPKYRVQTLRAARSLYPGGCVEYSAVRAAWTSVGVPAQPGEPGC